MMQNETLTVRFAPEDTALETSAKLAQIARDSFIPEKKKLHLRSIANVWSFVENLCEYGLLRPPCSEDRRNILTILSNCMSSKLFLDAVGSHANPLIVGALGLDQEADSGSSPKPHPLRRDVSAERHPLLRRNFVQVQHGDARG